MLTLSPVTVRPSGEEWSLVCLDMIYVQGAEESNIPQCPADGRCGHRDPHQVAQVRAGPAEHSGEESSDCSHRHGK